jgi:hypothetical protein
MFTPPPFVFRASPEKLRDYSEHQAATYHFPDAFYGQSALANP